MGQLSWIHVHVTSSQSHDYFLVHWYMKISVESVALTKFAKLIIFHALHKLEVLCSQSAILELKWVLNGRAQLHLVWNSKLGYCLSRAIVSFWFTRQTVSRMVNIKCCVLTTMVFKSFACCRIGRTDTWQMWCICTWLKVSFNCAIIRAKSRWTASLFF